jgi:putative ABC transport system ATP-binding protein
MGLLEVPALNGVDLEITGGEFVAITGPSGSGKSTLLNLLGLVDVPTRGRLVLAGADTSRLTSDERAEFRLRHVGFVFQFLNLFLELSALDNVRLPAMLLGEDRIACRSRAMELLDVVGLAARVNHEPGQLSGGEQQRVSIARALVNRPAVLLADEPSAHLDSARAQEIMELLARLNRETGQTIVLVTHERAYCSLAQRTIVLKDGRIETAASGAP